MTATIDLTLILALPVAQRIGVAQTILDSIAADVARPSLSDELKAELDRRVADDDANPDAAVSWAEVEAAALARRRG